MSRVGVTQCQRQLATIWYVLSAPAIVVLILQSQNNVYAGKDAELWGWALPTVMPTLLLITGAVVVDEIQAALKVKRSRYVPVFSRNVAIGLSVFYLLIVNYVVFHSRATGFSLSTMQKSNLFLGPIQGLVGIALAIFFGTSESNGKEAVDPQTTASRSGGSAAA